MLDGQSSSGVEPYESPRIEGDAYVLREFEVQWRPHLTTHWSVARSYDNRRDAALFATRQYAEFAGQVRIVHQTVIAAAGLGEGDVD